MAMGRDTSCAGMIARLLAVDNPDARLRRFLRHCNPQKLADGAYYSVSKCAGLPIVELMEGERWERILTDWIEYITDEL